MEDIFGRLYGMTAFSNIIAVSYTHLDVYKRQILYMANNNEIERRRTFAIIAHPDAGKTSLTEKPVSYTHLDVYKRQVYLIGQPVFAGNSFQLQYIR